VGPADLVVATGAGEARDLAVVASAQAVIAVGGGWGTLAEIGLARKLGRPVVRLRSWRIAPPEGDGAEVGPVAESPEEAVRLALEAAS
jgi:predicted Rossmann-fold nucleotide-binding protein